MNTKLRSWAKCAQRSKRNVNRGRSNEHRMNRVWGRCVKKTRHSGFTIYVFGFDSKHLNQSIRNYFRNSMEICRLSSDCEFYQYISRIINARLPMQTVVHCSMEIPSVCRTFSTLCVYTPSSTLCQCVGSIGRVNIRLLFAHSLSICINRLWCITAVQFQVTPDTVSGHISVCYFRNLADVSRRVTAQSRPVYGLVWKRPLM